MVGTPLFDAVCAGDLDEVKRLVDQGVNLEQSDTVCDVYYQEDCLKKRVYENFARTIHLWLCSKDSSIDFLGADTGV